MMMEVKTQQGAIRRARENCLNGLVVTMMLIPPLHLCVGRNVETDQSSASKYVMMDLIMEKDAMQTAQVGKLAGTVLLETEILMLSAMRFVEMV